MKSAWVLASMLVSIWAFEARSERVLSIETREILAKTVKIFQPVAEESNLKFEIKISKEKVASAGADFDGSTYTVTLSQGYLNHPRLTADVLRITLCHEIGHFFGGSPRRSVPPEWTGPIAEDGLSFMSSEGQADYYATSVCFRKLTEKIPKPPQWASEVVKEKCQKSFASNEIERILCERSILASEGFLILNQKTSIDVAKPDLNVTEGLIRDTYPSRQCRLDTMVRGSLCPTQSYLAFDFFNPNRNDCSAISHLQRPSCWYR